MARYFALEWDAVEARVVVARSWGSDAVVEHAFSVPLEDGEGDLGTLIQREVAELNLARCDTLVALGRSSTELRLMQLPPAPIEELPDMVRMQAMREFANIGEEWPLDFVHVDSAHDESLNLLAATISPQMINKIRSDCMEFNQTPSRVVLRPFATASLLRRSDQTRPGECSVVVDLLAQEADISVLSDSRVAVMRTVRLPATDNTDVICRAILGELRRTIPAAQNQLGGQRADHVTILGGGELHQQLSEAVMEASLASQVDLFDPFEAVGAEPSARDIRPEHPGRYASLLGMICDEAAGDSHAFDFLNPRKRIEPPKYDVRKISLAAGLAVTILLAIGYYFLYINGLKAKIAELKKTNNDNMKMVKRHEKMSTDLNTIQAFADNDITWLDKLLLLAKAIPSAEDAILTQISGAAHKENGALMVDGYITDPTLIKTMEDALRENFKTEVDGNRGTFNKARDKYKWQFYERVTVLSELGDRNARLKEEAAKKAAADKSGKTAETATKKADSKKTAAKKASAKASPKAKQDAGKDAAKKKEEKPAAKKAELKKDAAKKPDESNKGAAKKDAPTDAGKKAELKKDAAKKPDELKKDAAKKVAPTDAGKKEATKDAAKKAPPKQEAATPNKKTALKPTLPAGKRS